MSDQQDDGKVVPLNRDQNADPLGGDRMLDGMKEYITGRIPTKLVPPEQREDTCMDFVEMLGRLVEFMEKFHPMTPAKMAALMFFFEQLDLQRMGDDQAFVVVTLVDAAKNAARKMRKEARTS